LLESGLLSCGHAFVYLEEFQEGQPLCLAAISTLANLPRGQQDFRAHRAAHAGASSARGQNAYLMREEGESIRLGIGGDSSGGRLTRGAETRLLPFLRQGKWNAAATRAKEKNEGGVKPPLLRKK